MGRSTLMIGPADVGSFSASVMEAPASMIYEVDRWARDPLQAAEASAERDQPWAAQVFSRRLGRAAGVRRAWWP